VGAIANAGRYVEFSIEGPDYYPWQDGIFTPALVARDGEVATPVGPGWGVDIEPGWLEAAHHMTSTWAR
jgi:L-alanine-DL-glutamate epimerase-like enolase superfamily enzyme